MAVTLAQQAYILTGWYQVHVVDQLLGQGAFIGTDRHGRIEDLRCGGLVGFIPGGLTDATGWQLIGRVVRILNKAQFVKQGLFAAGITFGPVGATLCG